MTRSSPPTCPCGSPSYAECCEPLHDGVAEAPTAEALMRARFSGYALGRLDYVFRTWHPRTRPDDVTPDGARWTGLRVIATEEGGADDDTGIVEFVASFEIDGNSGELRERSRFERRRARWVYVDEES